MCHRPGLESAQAAIKNNNPIELPPIVYTDAQKNETADLITNCQRISDHCSNLAVSLIRAEVDKMDAHAYLGSLKAGEDREFVELYTQYKKKYNLD